jgi:hypothetical protein
MRTYKNFIPQSFTISDPGERIQMRKPRKNQRQELARPEGFEPPTPWFVARYSIQLSYGRFNFGMVKNTLENN